MNVKNIGLKREISEYGTKLNYTNNLFGLKFLDIPTFFNSNQHYKKSVLYNTRNFKKLKIKFI